MQALWFKLVACTQYKVYTMRVKANGSSELADWSNAIASVLNSIATGHLRFSLQCENHQFYG